MDVKKESIKLLEEIEDKEVLQTLYDYLLTVNKASTQSFFDWFGRNPAEYELYCRMPDYEREFFQRWA